MNHAQRPDRTCPRCGRIAPASLPACGRCGARFPEDHPSEPALEFPAYGLGALPRIHRSPAMLGVALLFLIVVAFFVLKAERRIMRPSEVAPNGAPPRDSPPTGPWGTRP